MYLSHIRPVIAFEISVVRQHMHSLKKTHLKIIYRILIYLKGSPSIGLFFKKNEARNLEVLTHAEKASSIKDRQSISGY